MLLECNNPRLIVLDLDQLVDWGFSDIERLIRSCPNTTVMSISTAQQSGNSYVRPLGRTIDLAMTEIMLSREFRPWETVFITGRSKDAALVGSLGVSTILWGDAPDLEHNQLPDFLATSHGALNEFLSGAHFGYFGELLAHGRVGKGLFHIYDQSHMLQPSVSAQVIVGGRYFPTDDRRHGMHPLSQKILRSKSGKHHDVLADLINHSLHALKRMQRVDFVTAVPGQDDSNRVGSILELASSRHPDLYTGIGVKSKILTLAHPYKSQKKSGGWNKRAVNVSGAFRISDHVTGNWVLIDDIITSGATVMECVKVLRDSGADKVVVVEFGASQDIKPRSETSIGCSVCGASMQLRFNGKDGTTLTYEVGRQQLNRRNIL